MDVSAGTLSSVAKQYYGNTWSASGSVRAWTWCCENVALEENNVDHIGCDHTSTKASDLIRTPKLSVLVGRAHVGTPVTVASCMCFSVCYDIFLSFRITRCSFY